MEPRGTELINRYKSNYRITDEFEIGETEILQHWDLEKQLTQELWASTPETRWEVFDRAYTRLYSELDWLNQLPEDPRSPAEKYQTWERAIGDRSQKIYEIGSGKGELISYLAELGFECKATEITRERGAKHVDTFANLTWASTDGVNLQQFEPNGDYDVVISNQVIEHFHPDDLLVHLQNVCGILKPSGRYIFSTPHPHGGPHDVSAVFKYNRSAGMHLKEYTYQELISPLSAAGFTSIAYILPAKFVKIFAKLGIDRPKQLTKIGKIYFNLMLAIERLLFMIPNQNIRRLATKLLKKLYLFTDNILLVAHK